MQNASFNFKWLEPKSLRSGASRRMIEEVLNNSGMIFPEQYLEFLRYTNGYEGWIGKNYARFQSISELINWNKEYDFHAAVSGYFGIGSNGGGESFGFNSRSGEFYMVPFIAIGWSDAIRVGCDFNEFLTKLHDDKLFDER